MYVLHYAPDNASMIVRLALEEIGAPYRTALVDRRIRAQDSAAYRSVNPTGLIPALETPEGPIAETGAILLWLSERHGALGPAPGAPGRGAFLHWMLFLANTLHADLRSLFYPATYAGPDAKVQAAHHDVTAARLTRHLAMLDGRIAPGEGLLGGGEPTMADLYLAPMLRWMALYPQSGTGWFRLSDWPALHDLAARIEARPAAQRVALAEGLGPTPFTAPRLAAPPEGSAT